MPNLMVRAAARLVAAIVLLAAVGVAHAETAWLKAETPRFTVYSMGSEKTLKAYAERIELMDAAFWEVYGLQRPPPPPRKLPIYLVDKPGTLRQVAPFLADGVVGFYATGDDAVFAMALADDGNDYILLHEYAHHLMLQNFPYGYPAWLVEGYAEYFMGTTVEDSSIKVGFAPMGRSYDLNSQLWFPWETILTKRVSDIPPGRASLFYAQSWLLTHYLLSDPERAKQLQAYLTAIGQGQSSVAALEAATGMKADAWDRRLRTYGGGQMPYVQFKKSQFEKVTPQIVRLSAGESDLLLDDLHVRSEVADAKKAPLLTDIREKAARYPDDAFAQLALARAEIRIGDPDAGGARLKTYLAAHPNDVEALALDADRLMNLGDKTPARQAELYTQAGNILVAAFKLNPSRYQTLAAFARSRRGEPNYPSDNTLTALLTALKLAPQVGENRLAAAEGLIRRSRQREAMLILAPLANSPHDGALSKKARELMTEAAKASTKP
ncbi:MAG TPA: hypothetical protein VN158_07890 [Caulobacter sp.]|nr:hypothetical protein [Caulobacter sp.]